MKQTSPYHETNTPITVTCSCRETTTVQQLSPATKLYPANPNWKFKTLADVGESVKTAGQNKAQTTGWYCGKPGHEPINDTTDALELTEAEPRSFNYYQEPRLG